MPVEEPAFVFIDFRDLHNYQYHFENYDELQTTKFNFMQGLVEIMASPWVDPAASQSWGT